MKMKVHIIIEVTVLLFLSLNSNGQNKETVEKTIKDAINSVRNGKVIETGERDFSTLDAKIALNSLRKFKSDPSANVRFAVQTMQFKIAVRNMDTSIREDVTNSLVSDLLDGDPLVSQQAVRRLQSFKSKDFSTATKNLIGIVMQRADASKELFLVIGIAQVREQIPFLKNIAVGLNKHVAGWYASVEWYSALALARMGDKQETKRIIKIVESEADVVLRVTRLLSDVAYLRQIEGVKLLQKYLESEDRLPRVKDNVPGTKYNQYALDFLTQSIENFPVKNQGLGYNDAEVQLARSWMRSHSDYNLIR